MLDQYALETTMLSVQLAVSLLSFVGSLMIISQVSRSNINRSTPQQRLILLISVCDIVLGICWIFNPLLMYNSGVPYWARGNQVTCSVQGFMIQLSILTGALYQASLQLQYLLGIKYGWTQRQLKWGFLLPVTSTLCKLTTHVFYAWNNQRNIEKYLHFVPLVLGLATAILNLVLKNYNPADWDCWIAPYPSNCTSSYELTNGEETDCVRGDNASIYQLACFFGPLWLVIGFCLFVMCQIYSHVYTVESRTRRYQFSVDEQMKLTKEVKSQSILYVSQKFSDFISIWVEWFSCRIPAQYLCPIVYCISLHVVICQYN